MITIKAYEIHPTAKLHTDEKFVPRRDCPHCYVIMLLLFTTNQYTPDIECAKLGTIEHMNETEIL